MHSKVIGSVSTGVYPCDLSAQVSATKRLRDTVKIRPTAQLDTCCCLPDIHLRFVF